MLSKLLLCFFLSLALEAQGAELLAGQCDVSDFYAWHYGGFGYEFFGDFDKVESCLLAGGVQNEKDFKSYVYDCLSDGLEVRQIGSSCETCFRNFFGSLAGDHAATLSLEGLNGDKARVAVTMLTVALQDCTGFVPESLNLYVDAGFRFPEYADHMKEISDYMRTQQEVDSKDDTILILIACCSLAGLLALVVICSACHSYIVERNKAHKYLTSGV